jgi:transcriptional accessory protein Tex/SPT6
MGLSQKRSAGKEMLIMSDQETAVVEETAATEVEEQSEATTSEPSTAAEEAVETTEASASTPPVEAAESPSSEAEQAPVEIPEQSDSDDEQITIHSLKPRQYFLGKVKNITKFGAFVDIGIPQDGLVHISELSRQKVDKVTDVVSEGQEVDVWVKKVDKKRGRISLTMVKPVARRLRDIKEGDEFEGTVTRLESYGAFVDIDSDREGLVHISQITHDYINHPEEALAIGDKVNVKVLKVNRKKRQVDLSIKAMLPPPVSAKPESVKEVQSQADESPAAEEDPAPTAMALAYAAFQDEKEEEEPKEEASSKAKREHEELDAIIARTLASRSE